MRYVLITGVSSGIGLVSAQYLIGKGYFVFGSVRSEKRGNELRGQLGPNFHPLVFDVRDLEGIHRSLAEVSAIVKNNLLVALVNNAGIAVSGPIELIDQQEIKDQFDVNVVGLLNTTRAFLPLLGAGREPIKNPGRIINISSIASSFTFPFQTLYAASKHAVESINDGLRRELSLYGIKVISIRPGPIKSEIWQKQMKEDKLYQGTVYAPIFEKKLDLVKSKEAGASPTELVAKVIHQAIELPKPKLKYLIYKNHFLYYFSRMIPDRWADYLIYRQMGKIISAKTTEAPW
ncbi:MAG: SDR family NAD(P)-dependent oxidoreductase [Bacteroidia bacterium]|nr:SDR family NAD(P)-dependent oxidoreductase [Bacteroidia bacterium]